MKKIFALLLVAILCFSLASCGNKAEKEIVGEWKCENFFSRVAVAEFYKDGTGTLTNFSSSDTTEDFTWKYDKDLSSYTIVLESGEVVNTPIKTDDNGARYIKILGKFYSVEK